MSLIRLILIDWSLAIFALGIILMLILELINFVIIIEIIAPQVADAVILASKLFLLGAYSLFCIVVVRLAVYKFGTIVVVTDLIDLVESH